MNRVRKPATLNPKPCVRCSATFVPSIAVQNYCGSKTFRRGCSWIHSKENYSANKRGNPARYALKLFLNKRRRITLLAASGQHTLQEWEALKVKYKNTCPSCHRSEPEITLTEDHIIPLSRGGSDDISNIQPLCRPCNGRKSAKTIIYAH